MVVHDITIVSLVAIVFVYVFIVRNKELNASAFGRIFTGMFFAATCATSFLIFDQSNDFQVVSFILTGLGIIILIHQLYKGIEIMRQQ